MKKKVGIFAGTFDPIHHGHLAFARAGLLAGLDKVYFLVEPRPRRKQGVRALEHRRNMVDLAIKSNKKLGSIYYEKARLTPAEALPKLQARFKSAELVLLFGGDVISYMVDHIADWPNIEELAKSSRLMIAARNQDQTSIDKRLKGLKKHHGLPFKYDFVTVTKSDISSSGIRRSIKASQKPSGLPDEVGAYIADNGLYLADEIIS